MRRIEANTKEEFAAALLADEILAIEAATEMLVARTTAHPCGDCQACCELIGVEELGKPYQARCEHQCAGGCAVYDHRPQSCRDYECAWRTSELPPECRPDKCGLLLQWNKQPLGNGVCLEIHETRPNAGQSGWPDAIEQMIADARREGRAILFVPYATRFAARYPIAPMYPQEPGTTQVSGNERFYVLGV